MTTSLQHPAKMGETNVHVTVQQPASAIPSSEKMESKSSNETTMDASAALKQILGSLAETKRYLPQQVNSFLDSMEGKTIDDLRMEAMHLANKAQEEARKKTAETVETAKQRAQGLTDRAKARTSDLTQKGMDMVNNVVQPPLQATTGATKSLANKVNDTTMNIASSAWQKAQSTLMPYAETMKPMVAPYATKAKEYLPESARTFVEQNIEGKSPEELSKLALSKTRKNLLSVKANTDKVPTLYELLSEFRTATTSGDLFRNALSLSEQAANKAFGPTDIPKDQSALRRMYNLTFKVNTGMMDLTKSQLMMARQRAMDMTRQRLNAGTDMVMQRVSPILTRIGQLPVVPSFVFRLLRGEITPLGEGAKGSGTSAGLRMGMEETKGKAPEGLGNTAQTTTTTAAPTKQPHVSVKVDVKPTDAPQATTTTAVSDKQSATLHATAPSGNTMTQSKETIGNTNAQGLGDLGKAGMGVTTTGGEDKDEGESKKGKKHKL